MPKLFINAALIWGVLLLAVIVWGFCAPIATFQQNYLITDHNLSSLNISAKTYQYLAPMLKKHEFIYWLNNSQHYQKVINTKQVNDHYIIYLLTNVKQPLNHVESIQYYLYQTNYWAALFH